MVAAWKCVKMKLSNCDMLAWLNAPYVCKRTQSKLFQISNSMNVNKLLHNFKLSSKTLTDRLFECQYQRNITSLPLADKHSIAMHFEVFIHITSAIHSWWCGGLYRLRPYPLPELIGSELNTVNSTANVVCWLNIDRPPKQHSYILKYYGKYQPLFHSICVSCVHVKRNHLEWWFMPFERTRMG